MSDYEQKKARWEAMTPDQRTAAVSQFQSAWLAWHGKHMKLITSTDDEGNIGWLAKLLYDPGPEPDDPRPLGDPQPKASQRGVDYPGGS